MHTLFLFGLSTYSHLGLNEMSCHEETFLGFIYFADHLIYIHSQMLTST